MKMNKVVLTGLTIEQVLELAEDDLDIDYQGDIGHQTSVQPNLFTKWTIALKAESTKLRLMNIKHDKLKTDLWIYYTGKADPEVYQDRPMNNRYLKGEVDTAMNQNKEWIEHKVRTILQEELVDVLERIVAQIKDRAWTLKSVQEWKKFMSDAAG